jgi:hypothetical protein
MNVFKFIELFQGVICDRLIIFYKTGIPDINIFIFP